MNINHTMHARGTITILRYDNYAPIHFREIYRNSREGELALSSYYPSQTRCSSNPRREANPGNDITFDFSSQYSIEIAAPPRLHCA